MAVEPGWQSGDGEGPEAVLVGSSRAMQRVRTRLIQVARLPWHVRLEGPSGSGKSLAARVLHRLSPRRSGPFHVCHLNLLSEGTAIAELRGYERGAFSGAVASHRGPFEAASGGTLLLEEVGTASQPVQQALLQLVEERMVHRMGSARHIPMDVRLVFATNENLEAAVAAGPFRHDLYFRLGKLLVTFPPLVEHLEDVPELVPVLLRRLAVEASVPIPTVSPGALGLLTSYPWPGNVRELEGALQHHVAFGDLPDDVVTWGRQERWRERIEEALEQCRGNKSSAADLLGIRRQTLHKELRRRRPQRAS